MQLTGPLFLFVFLPLSLLFVPFCPRRYRKVTLTLISILWYVLANLSSPLALVQIFAAVSVCTLFAALPDSEYSKIRLIAGISLPLLLFIGARVLAEYGPESYPYPMGLTFVTLGAISMAIDRYRGDAPGQDDPLSVAGYLLFFPVLTMGPVLRYKQYLYMMEHGYPDMGRFSYGARLYMLGVVKRLAVAAVLLRALEDLLSFGTEMFSMLALLVALFLSFALFYFFVSGGTDMARGLMAIYGMQPPRAQASSLRATTPSRMFYGFMLSLDRMLEDYITRPLVRRLGKIKGGLIATVAVFVITVFFYRLRPEMLLLGLPILIFALLTLHWGRFERRPYSFVLHILCVLFSACAVSFFTLGLVLDEPMELFTLLGSAFKSHASYSLPYVYSAVPDIPYLTVIGVLFALILPMHRFWPQISRRFSPRMRMAMQSALGVLLLTGFVATLVHFLPQFPEYASTAARKLFL